MGLGGTRSDYTPPYEFLTKNPNFGRTRKHGEKTARIPNVLLVLISARIPNVPRRSSSTLPCFLVVLLLTLISASSRPHLVGDSLVSFKSSIDFVELRLEFGVLIFLVQIEIRIWGFHISTFLSNPNSETMLGHKIDKFLLQKEHILPSLLC